MTRIAYDNGFMMLCLQQAKAWDKAREAFEMAAKCSQRQDSPWHAAKHLEETLAKGARMLEERNPEVS